MAITIVYYSNYTIGSTEITKSIEYGTHQVKIIENPFERKDYNIAYWCNNRDGHGDQYFIGKIYTFDENTKLYAIWKEYDPAVTTKITFEPGTGEGTSFTVYVKRDSTYTLPDQGDYKKRDFKFLGWYCYNDEKVYNPGDKIHTTTDLIRFRAKWETPEDVKVLGLNGLDYTVLKIGDIFNAIKAKIDTYKEWFDENDKEHKTFITYFDDNTQQHKRIEKSIDDILPSIDEYNKCKEDIANLQSTDERHDQNFRDNDRQHLDINTRIDNIPSTDQFKETIKELRAADADQWQQLDNYDSHIKVIQSVIDSFKGTLDNLLAEIYTTNDRIDELVAKQTQNEKDHWEFVTLFGKYPDKDKILPFTEALKEDYHNVYDLVKELQKLFVVLEQALNPELLASYMHEVDIIYDRISEIDTKTKPILYKLLWQFHLPENFKDATIWVDYDRYPAGEKPRNHKFYREYTIIEYFELISKDGLKHVTIPGIDSVTYNGTHKIKGATVLDNFYLGELIKKNSNNKYTSVDFNGGICFISYTIFNYLLDPVDPKPTSGE